MAAALSLVLTASAQEKLWVSSAGAAIKAEKSASSETVENLSVGEELTILSVEGRWYQVSAKSGKKGWIYRGKVSKYPPGSIRMKKAESRQKTASDPQYRQALDKILNLSVTQNEIEDFLKAGKIGEYAQ